MAKIIPHPEFKIRLSVPRPEKNFIMKFRCFPAATISDALGKRSALPANIKQVYKPCRKIVGPAYTVSVSPGDELLALKAIQLAEPGDVIIISGAGPSRYCLWGGIMSTMAKVRGIEGLVTDGFVRDVEQTRSVDFPIYAAGVTPVAPAINVPPGSINYPIAFGEVVINPGDLVVGDEDGVVVIPQGELEKVAESVEQRMLREEEWLKDIHATKSMILAEMVDKLLQGRVVEIIE